MKLHDISMEISSGMPVYKNKKEKKPVIEITRTIKQGSNETKLHLDAHTGTHADAYYHMLARGKTIGKHSIEQFIGDAVVLDFTKVKNNMITDSDLTKQKAKIRKNDIVLLKTRKHPMTKFDKNFTYIERSGAQFLANKRIKCVGIDQLGVERAQPDHETHVTLFKNKIAAIEGLELSRIKPGRYFFIGLPLKIKNGDASPIRAVLMER